MVVGGVPFQLLGCWLEAAPPADLLLVGMGGAGMDPSPEISLAEVLFLIEPALGLAICGLDESSEVLVVDKEGAGLREKGERLLRTGKEATIVEYA